MIKKLLVLMMLLLPLKSDAKDFIILNNHEEAIKQEDKVILIFGADWCRYCLLLKNNLESLNLNNYKICFIDVDKNTELKTKYNVKSLPTSIILLNNKIISRKIGFDKNDYNKWLDENKQQKQQKQKNNNLFIRVLILKHSNEQMASDDANMIVNAIQKASSDLNVESIGNHFIHETKKIRFSIYECAQIENLKNFVVEKLKINSNINDTVILFTIGHGSPNGNLHNLGPRSDLQKSLAEAAEICEQKILWWQLSCYAAANLPNIDSLTHDQQKLFSVLNTSDEATPSPAYLEGKIIEKLFNSMINCDADLDHDQNQEITGLELKYFLNKIKKGRGDLLRMLDLNEPIFGVDFANKIKIIDHTNNMKLNRYIPIPKK